MSTHSHHSAQSHQHKSENRREHAQKMQAGKESQEISATKKNEEIKSRSGVIKNLIKEKQQEKEHAQKREKEQKEAKDKMKNSFKIPKKKPDVEKLINSLFDDTEAKTKNDHSGLSDKKDTKHKTETDSSDMKNSSSSHKEKHSLPSSNNVLDKRRDIVGNTPEKPLSSAYSSTSHKSHSNHKSSISSSKHSEHKSSSSSENTRSSSANKDSKNKSSSNSEIKSSSKSRDTEHSGKDSSSSGTKHSSSHSLSKSHSSSSSKQRESSSKPELASTFPSSKPELTSTFPSSKPELKLSPSASLNNSSSPRATGTQPTMSAQQPIVLNKHHLHPIVERQASTGLSEKEKILARLQAIKQRTLEAIHKENNAKGKRFKGEKSQRKSKSEVKHDDKTKSVEIVKDIVSSDEEEKGDSGIPSALDIMLSERNAKLEKEKIARMAKQAWERATKKDTDVSNDVIKVKKKHRSSKNVVSTDKHKSKKEINHKRRERSLSPHNDSRKSSPKPKKPVLVRRSIQTGAPPMDFKTILEMAEKKQKEPPKVATTIPKKKKEEDQRPLTQEEKDRLERKKSKEYQDWLKFGGKPPSKNDISDEEEQQPRHSSNNIVDKKYVSSSTDKNKASSGSSRPSFNKNTSDKDRSQHRVTANGDSNNKLRNITINENVLVCGPAGSSEDEGSPDRSENPFDRIMNKFHKKRPAPPSRSVVPAKKNHFDDSEQEDYDSAMDDFIDDGEGNEPDYSKEIKKLFGYDKSKYKNETDDDLSDMEADFSTVMREEKRSAKLGLMEDLEDMKKEQEELKRKAMLKKRK